MSAVVDKIARVEVWPSCGLTVVGWEHSKPCGCRALEGMRLDKNEPVISIDPCDDHRAEGDALLRSMRVDISDGTLHDTLAERFERFIP